jgi:uncharacterized membrane-anchored protein
MSDFLDKLKGKLPQKNMPQNMSVPRNQITVSSVGPISRPLQNTTSQNPASLSTVSMIYAAAAAVLGVIAIYYLFKGQWITGLIMIVPTGCLGGFAYFTMKR